MTKAQWYNFLFKRIDEALEKEFYFEAAFICYGIIEDRLNSLMRQNSLPNNNLGVAKKIKALAKVRNYKAETILLFDNWDGGKYTDHGLLKDIQAWGILYRNPMQHVLGDPREYKTSIGSFHNEHTKNLALEGKWICRDLSSLVMRYKK
jgi:hypothetical protein